MIVPRHEPLHGGLIRRRPTIAKWFRTFPEGVQEYQQAELGYLWPMDAAVNDDGALLLFDSWGGNIGTEVIAVVDSRGSMLRRYSLEDLYTADQLRRFDQTTSTINWRCPTSENPWRSNALAEVMDTAGGVLSFAADGSVKLGNAPPCVADSDFLDGVIERLRAWIWVLSAALIGTLVFGTAVGIRARRRSR